MEERICERDEFFKSGVKGGGREGTDDVPDDGPVNPVSLTRRPVIF